MHKHSHEPDDKIRLFLRYKGKRLRRKKKDESVLEWARGLLATRASDSIFVLLAESKNIIWEMSS